MVPPPSFRACSSSESGFDWNECKMGGMELDDALYADRSERAKLVVSGPQRLWFLHQVLTQSFEDIQPGEARDAAMITAHGRMTGFLEAVAAEDAVFCHFEAESRTGLIESLRRYVFATQVELEDLTDELGLILVAGPNWSDAAESFPLRAPVHPTSSLGLPAAYLWVARADLEDAVSGLLALGFRPGEEAELEAIRIANGRPRWGHEMDEKTFPQEAGIDLSAVHFAKGCYLGQEAMAKIHFRGKVNRRLVRLEGRTSMRRGGEIRLEDSVVGKITSAFDGTALALVRHTVEPGSLVMVGDSSVTVID